MDKTLGAEEARRTGAKVPRLAFGTAAAPGIVHGLFIATREGMPMLARRRVRVSPGRGIDGDRYALGTGYWSSDERVSRDLTLIEEEAVAGAGRALGATLRAHELRRNVVTRGIRLAVLVGTRFRIGDVVLEATGLCEPCLHLERTIGKPVLKALLHRGGIRANVLTPGAISFGAAIQLDAPPIGVGVIVRKRHAYLLGLRRSGQGTGTWSVPGGVLEPGESVIGAALRELREETGIEGMEPTVVAQATNRLDDGRTWRSIFVSVRIDAGDVPVAREPDKVAAWEWFDLTSFPDPLFGPTAAVLRGSTELTS